MTETKRTYIKCLGMDMKLHICEPKDKVTKCGVEVRRKKLTMLDFSKYFSCSECTY